MNHDQLFKDLLSSYFIDFLELFAPEVLRFSDPSTLEFVDKEVFADLPEGQRGEADLCARLKFREGERIFLVHLEHEAQRRGGFGLRMFDYYVRLHLKYRCPIYPVALFSFPTPYKLQPDHYKVEFPDLRPLEFRYRVVQLNRLEWREFLERPNPAAAALMSRMRIAPADRPRVKVECLRILVQLRLEPSRLRFLAGFVDQYLRLSVEETGIFRQELEKSTMRREERERVMELTTSWELKGRTEGLQQGRMEGLKTSVAHFLERRFGSNASSLQRRIQALESDVTLTRLLDALIDQADLESLNQILHEDSGKNID